jgi:hypothetical protein
MGQSIGALSSEKVNVAGREIAISSAGEYCPSHVHRPAKGFFGAL